MFHSRGTVQSNTAVPDGTSWMASSGQPLLQAAQRLADAVAGDAAADRIELGDQTVQLRADPAAGDASTVDAEIVTAPPPAVARRRNPDTAGPDPR